MPVNEADSEIFISQGQEKISELESRKAKVLKDMNDMASTARNEGRDLTPNEVDEFKSLQERHEYLETQLQIQVDLEGRNTEAVQPKGRKAEADADINDIQPVPKNSSASTISRSSIGNIGTGTKKSPALSMEVGLNRLLASPTHTFQSMSQFAHAVRNAAVGRQVDHRLQANLQQEGVGTDGGFAVPPQYVQEIYKIMWGDEVSSLAPYCQDVPMMTNTVKLPISMDTPYGGDGVTAYWGGEGSTHTASSARMETVTLTLNKLTVLVKATDELLEDGAAIESFLQTAAAEALGYTIGESIIEGDGAGRPKGITNAEALVVVPKETSQTNGTIVEENISKMFSRLPQKCQINCIWLVSPSAFPQLQSLKIGDQPVFLPPGGLSDSPYSTIFKRPVIIHAALQPRGRQGDIILADLNQYYWGSKYNGIKSATSMHMDFDKDLVNFKFQMRVDGRPKWSKAITQAKGSETWSPFVTLAAR